MPEVLSQRNMLSKVGAGRHAWTGKREKYLHGRWEYEQRKCDYSVNLNQNNKVSINDKLIVFYFEESSKLISPKSFIVQYGYVILPKGE